MEGDHRRVLKRMGLILRKVNKLNLKTMITLTTNLFKLHCSRKHPSTASSITKLFTKLKRTCLRISSLKLLSNKVQQMRPRRFYGDPQTPCLRKVIHPRSKVFTRHCSCLSGLFQNTVMMSKCMIDMPKTGCVKPKEHFP